MMKKLRLLLLPCCLLFALLSCKKSSTSPTSVTGTMTATINGTAQTFNVGAIANLQSAGGTYTLGMEGLSAASGSANSMIISITTTSPIVAGTYTASSSAANVSYTQANANVYQYDGSSGSGPSVVIKSISSTSVSGTFTGTLQLINGSGASSVAITNGAFNLKIQ
jgi:hypothetical protein